MCVYLCIYTCTYVRTYVCAQCSEHFALCRLLCVFLCRLSAPLLHTHSSPLALSLLCVRAALLQVCFHRYLFLIFLAFSLDVQRCFSFSLFVSISPPPPSTPTYIIMFLYTAVRCTSSSFHLVPLRFPLPALNIIILLIRFLFSLIDVSCRRRSIFVAVAVVAVFFFFWFCCLVHLLLLVEQCIGFF